VRPWDAEASPLTDNRARCAESMQEEEEVVAASFARNEEKRRRAAERLLEQFYDCWGMLPGIVKFTRVHYDLAKIHLAAAREEDNEIQNLQ
jgi:hypothetical protein